jgi:hypothetical protein
VRRKVRIRGKSGGWDDTKLTYTFHSFSDDDSLIPCYRHMILPQGAPGLRIVLSSVLNHTSRRKDRSDGGPNDRLE